MTLQIQNVSKPLFLNMHFCSIDFLFYVFLIEAITTTLNRSNSLKHCSCGDETRYDESHADLLF